jgi:uncharacterized protein (DUF885 family)
MDYPDTHLCRAQNVIERVWRRLSDGFKERFNDGRSIEAFPDLSEEQAERLASEARASLAEIETIDVATLPHSLALTLKIVAFQLTVEAQAASRYWLAQECFGHPGMFLVGPYGGGYLFNAALKVFARFSFRTRADCDRYLALIEDYVRLLEQMDRKLQGQAQRGIRIPQPALPAIRRLLADQQNAACDGLPVVANRLLAIQAPSGYTEIVARRVADRVVSAFAALLDAVGDEYARQAPESVGIGQFTGGQQVYESLVAQHLSMDMTSDAVHRAGVDRMRQIQAEMEHIRTTLGYADRGAFHRSLLSDPAWIARSQEHLQSCFDAAIRRIEPHVERLFRFKPSAQYSTKRLDAKLEGGLTYGYYQPPMVGHPQGTYYFNGSNLSERTLTTAASLIYHELIPGHHFHIASQQENELLHPLRKRLLFVAFNEGWAEYAATLAGEIGMYEDLREQYGRLSMDAFLTSRLVVDTGMNALGWSLQRARQYLCENTLMSDAEIRSETLRYSTDIPAQSLAYKMGEFKLHELRNLARSTLGGRFDIQNFHDVVLGCGGMPLQVLEWHVNRWLQAQISPRQSKVPAAAS